MRDLFDVSGVGTQKRGKPRREQEDAKKRLKLGK